MIVVAYADLMAADPGIWRDQARAWGRLGDQLDGHADALSAHTSVLGQAWQGGGVDGAIEHSACLVTTWRSRAEVLRRVGRLLSAHADRTDTVRRRAVAVGEAAGPTHEVGADGSVGVTPWAVVASLAAPWQIPALDRRTGELAAELTAVLAQATAIDDESARALGALAADDPAGSGPTVTVPASTTPPAEVHRWWESLDDAQREQLLSADPARIGALDGVPVVDRDRANRIVLDSAHEEAADQRDAALRRPPGDERDDAVDAADEKVRALRAIDDRLNATGRDRAYLLGIDTGGTGRAIVAVGNPDTADNVVTYVPGTGARLGGAVGDVVRADEIVQSARAADPRESTAAVAWVGYEAPQAIVGWPPGAADATNPRYAEAAGGRLDRFQDGLRATHEGAPSHNTVLGHSYGSTVVGHAAREHGLAADDLVFVGSPGVGTDTVVGLGHDPDRVWSSHIGNDPIQYGYHPGDLLLGGTDLIHGRNPSDPEFGAETFGAQEGSVGFDAHSEYWVPQSESWRNLGRIAVGDYDQVTR